RVGGGGGGEDRGVEGQGWGAQWPGVATPVPLSISAGGSSRAASGTAAPRGSAKGLPRAQSKLAPAPVPEPASDPFCHGAVNKHRVAYARALSGVGGAQGQEAEKSD